VNDKERPQEWEEFVEALAEGRLPILKTMKAVTPHIYEAGDHLGFVNFTRAFHMLMKDERILRRLHSEIGEEIAEVMGKDFDVGKVERGIRSKDGPRRIAKLGSVHAELYGDSPSLIALGTFQECLAQYSRLVGHVENVWNDACQQFRAKKYPFCTFFSIFAIEEIGKLGRLWFDLLAWDRPQNVVRKELGQLSRDHRKKHFMGVMSGAVVNARLDRILGVRRIKQLLQDAESGQLERLRQSCLYIDMQDGRTITPADVIGEDTAKFFVVLAGELWAEVLGHFPWEFEKMNKKVTAFEIEIGIPKEVIERE